MGERAPSHLRAALRVLAAGLRRGEEPAAGPGAPRRRVAVERSSIAIDPRRLERWRAATRTSAAPDPEVVPAVYSSTWETALALELFATGELPLPRRGLVHLESELVALRPLRAADRVRCRVELDRAEPHPRGTRVELRARHWNAAGQLCQESSSAFLVPGEGGSGRGSGRDPDGGDAPEAREWRTLDEWRLPADLGRRYARASGDFNPVHLWSWSARLLGFDRPILHGFCTAAMVAGALADRCWGGSPTALRRLRIRLRAPLFLPAHALLRVAADPGADHGLFRVVDAGAPGRPLAEGGFVGG